MPWVREGQSPPGAATSWQCHSHPQSILRDWGGVQKTGSGLRSPSPVDEDSSSILLLLLWGMKEPTTSPHIPVPQLARWPRSLGAVLCGVSHAVWGAPSSADPPAAVSPAGPALPAMPTRPREAPSALR